MQIRSLLKIKDVITLKIYRRNFIYLAILCFIFLFLAINYERSDSTLKRMEQDVIATTETGVYKGDLAEDFQLLNSDGELVSLASFKGKKVFLNFFATWCSPCQEEIPTLIELQRKMGTENFVVLAVNVTKEERNPNDVKKFIEHFNIDFDVLLDHDGKVRKQYQLIGIPTSFFIDEKGKIVERLNGILTLEMIENHHFFK